MIPKKSTDIEKYRRAFTIDTRMHSSSMYVTANLAKTTLSWSERHGRWCPSKQLDCNQYQAFLRPFGWSCDCHSTQNPPGKEIASNREPFSQFQTSDGKLLNQILVPGIDAEAQPTCCNYAMVTVSVLSVLLNYNYNCVVTAESAWVGQCHWMTLGCWKAWLKRKHFCFIYKKRPKLGNVRTFHSASAVEWRG